MTSSRTTRYIITNNQGKFLIDLWQGKPTWSVAAQEAVTTGHAWLDLATARAKCLDCQRLLGEPLRLSLLMFIKINGSWRLEQQQGVLP